MTPNEAIETLDRMQRQIIHGSRIFGDIADVIRNLDSVRVEALKELGTHLELEDRPPETLLHAHRILATNNPEGITITTTHDTFSVDNTAKD